MVRQFPYQKKLVVKRRKRFFLISLYFLLGFILVLIFLSWLSHSESFTIKSFSISGIDEQKTLIVQSLALGEISKKYIYLFPKKNIFLYPKNSIEKEIMALPFVQNVEINKNSLNEVSIVIETRTESARWCENISTETVKKCFSIDEEGFIFAEVSTSTAFIYRGLISDVPVGRHILPSNEFKAVQFFIRELGRLGISPREAEFGESGYMTIFLLSGGRLILNTNDDLSQVLSNISSILADKTVAPTISGFLEKLDYIKLDSGNKVVYKLK